MLNVQYVRAAAPAMEKSCESVPGESIVEKETSMRVREREEGDSRIQDLDRTDVTAVKEVLETRRVDFDALSAGVS